MSREAPPIELLQKYAENFNKSATMRFFGTVIDFPTPDRVRVTLPVKPEQRGGLGSAAVNGGVIAAVFDLVIGSSAALVDPTRRSATVQISLSFERPVHGDVITAEGWIDRAGGRTGFASAVLKDGNGEICARAQGVIRLTDQRWADGFSPAIN